MNSVALLLDVKAGKQKSARGRTRIYDDIDPLRQRETVSKWLLNLKDGVGRKTAIYSFARFLRWRKEKGLESDPDALIEDCLDGTAKVHIKHLDTALQYCQNLFDCSASTKMRAYKTLRSFYEGNRIALPKAKLKVTRSASQVKGETTAFEFLGMVRQALDFCKVRDRAIILLTLQGGMDDSTFAEGFNRLAFSQLVKHFGSQDWNGWDASKCPARIILVRPKSDYRFYTFVDVDGVEALKQWLQVRPGARLQIHASEDPSLLPMSDPIFLTKEGQPIGPQTVSNIYREVGKRAGVNVSNGLRVEQFRGARIRYPFHSHEVRDTLVTLARSCHADVEVAQFITGHSIDDLKYDKSAWNDAGFFRAEYLKIARPALNPVTGKVLEAEREISKRFEERLSSLEKQIEDRLASARS